jgi:biotin carboxyl carrier protein
LPALDSVRVQIGAHSAEVRVIDRKRRRAGAHSGGEGEQTLCAPMPGKVVAILASVGDAVDVGQGIVVVEAMKMQNEVKAAMAGVVADIRVGIGDTVNAGQVLGSIA